MRILGIDPGINGACALFVSEGGEPFGGTFDLPTMGEEAKRELNYVDLRNKIYALKPDIVVLERAMAMPSIPGADGSERRTMGSASTFKFGGSWYAIKAVVACLEIPMFPPVMPGTWKRHFNLPGGDAGKEPSRQMVIQRFPQLAPFLTRKLDHQRAEAFLIALWYAETGGKSAARKSKPKQAPVFAGIDDDDDLDIPD
jgi:hypothetical protein